MLAQEKSRLGGKTAERLEEYYAVMRSRERLRGATTAEWNPNQVAPHNVTSGVGLY